MRHLASVAKVAEQDVRERGGCEEAFGCVEGLTFSLGFGDETAGDGVAERYLEVKSAVRLVDPG